MRTTKARVALVAAAAISSLTLLAAPAGAATSSARPPSLSTASPLPICHAGTDGGRRGIMNCTGGPGHVRLDTHCVGAPDADSGWIFDSGGPFHYDNTCLFMAASADALVEP